MIINHVKHAWLFLVAFSIGSTVGCDRSSEPVATEKDELQQYLDDHPELKAPKQEYDLDKEKFKEV